MKEHLKKLYEGGGLSHSQLLAAVAKGWITVMEAAEIAGEDRAVEVAQGAKLAELSAACAGSITAGCDVVLSGGQVGHISLTAEDQINLTNACAAVEGGAEGYPYHLDGALCALYPAADILAMGATATAHKLYHTTYYNHLAAWVRRCETLEELSTVTYGAALPEDLAQSMAAILSASEGSRASRTGGT